MQTTTTTLPGRLASLRRNNRQQPQTPDRNVPIGDPVTSNDVEIRITRGRARELRRAVDQPVFLIGRSPDCDLVLADPRFGDVHCYLYVMGGCATLGVVADQPPVLLNGQPVERAQLADGDRIRTGGFEFAVDVPAVEPPPATLPMTPPPGIRPKRIVRRAPQVDSDIEQLLRDVGRWLAEGDEGTRATAY